MGAADVKDLTVAVARLGGATEAARAALAPLPREVVALARRLSADGEAASAARSLRARHAEATAALAVSLDAVWPRSSTARPADADEAVATCRAIAEVAAEPASAMAMRLAALPGPDATRMASEADHVLETESRLDRLGIPAAPALADGNTRAAMALDALAAEHDLKDAAEAEARLSALDAACRAAGACEEPATRAAAALGFGDATASQFKAVALALSRLGRPWHPLLDLTGDPVVVAGTLEARAAALAEMARLFRVDGIPGGTGWTDEAPSKLAAASVILSNPSDARGHSARAFATSWGLAGTDEEMSAALLSMARAVRAREAVPPVPEGTEGLSDPGDPDTPDGCLAAAAAARELGAWLDAMDSSSLSSMALAALRGMAPRERDATLVDAVAASAGLPALATACPSERLGGIAGRLAARKTRISDLLAEVALADDPALAARAARSLRERRLALSRICASPGFEASGASGPEDVVEAQAWVGRLRKLLPPGIEPTSPSVEAKVIPAAAVALRDALEVTECLSEAECLVPGGFGALALAEGAMGPVSALAEARAAVSAVDGWDTVARLEAQDLPPSEWAAALEAEATMPEAPSEHPREADRDAVPEFDFRDADRWVESNLEVLPPLRE